MLFSNVFKPDIEPEKLPIHDSLIGPVVKPRSDSLVGPVVKPQSNQ